MVHYTECGTGLPILFIHGVGGCRHMFSHYTFPRLKGTGRLIAIDLPGYDDTPTLRSRHTIQAYCQLIPDLLDALEITRCHVVGISMGGTIGLKAAAHYPHRIISICASGAIIHGATSFPGWLRGALTTFLSPVTVFPHGPLRRFGRAFLARRSIVQCMGKMVNPVDLALLGKEYPDIAVHAVRNSSPRVWAENIMDLISIDLRDELMTLSVPTMLLDGERVHLKFVRLVKESASCIPEKMRHTATVPLAGHLAPFTNPKGFAALLRNFHLQHSYT